MISGNMHRLRAAFARWRKVGVALISGALALLCTACVVVEEIDTEGSHLNPRFRPDLLPLTEAQIATPVEKLEYGPYRVQSDELVSRLYPNSTNRRQTTNLPQSDCLWLSDAGSRGGDWVDLSWEQILLVNESAEMQREGFNFPEGGQFALCDYADPVTREPYLSWQLHDFDEIEVLVNGQPVTIYRQEEYPGDLAFVVLTTTEASDDPLLLTEPYQFGGPTFFEMTQRQSTYARADEASHNSCQPEVFTEPTAGRAVRHNISDSGSSLFTCISTDASVAACGLRCQYKPVGDTQLLSHALTFSDGPDVSTILDLEWASPAMLVVPPTGRTIARPMTRLDDSGRYEWRIGVEIWPGNPDLQRWTENFTPQIVIERVAVFYRDADGQTRAVTRFDDESLTARINNTAVLSCNADAGGSFPVGDSALSPHPCGTVRAFNPAYDIEQLEDVAGRVLAQPLTWQITVPELAGEDSAGREVFIEFELEVMAVPAALSFDQHTAVFEPVASGDKSQRQLRVRNVGGQPIRVEHIAVMNNYEGGHFSSDPSAFSYRVPFQPQWLPMNIGFTGVTEKNAGTALEVLATFGDKDKPSLAEAVAPFFEAVQLGESATVVRATDLDGQTLSLLGEEITFDGAVAFYQTPSVNFVERARSRLLDTNARFALGRAIYRDRLTPFVLAPGESQDILVSFSPRGVGDKTARLDVSASVIGNGSPITIKAPLFGTALASATPELLPPVIRLPVQRANPHTGERQTVTSRPLLLINNGGVDLTWSQASIRGSQSTVFTLRELPSTTQRIAPGNSTEFIVEYRPPPCNAPIPLGPQDTWLDFHTSAGVVSVPLQASLQACRYEPVNDR